MDSEPAAEYVIKEVCFTGVMLFSVALRQFKAHEDLVLSQIPSFAIIVGPNNVGKSAILQAIALMKYQTQLQTSPNFPTGFLIRTGAREAKIEICPNAKSTPTVFRVSGDGPNQRPISIGSSDQRGDRWQYQTVLYLGPYRTGRMRFTYADIGEWVGVDGGEAWNTLFQMKVRDNPIFSEVAEAARSLGIGLESIRTLARGPNEGEIEANTYGNSTNVFHTGSGTQAVLPVLLQTAMTPRGWTLLLEEPEAHLHRGAIDGLVKFLGNTVTSKEIQVLATTHSLDFLVSLWNRVREGVAPKDTSVFVLDRDSNGRTSAERVVPGELSFKDFLMKVKANLAGWP